MKLSVVIPCLNEEHYVGGILSDLAAQLLPDMEVIVVDSNSTDGTIGAARAFAGRLPLKVVTGAKRGVANARNLGAAAARGEWLIFFDADVRIPGDFLTKALPQLEARGLDMASAGSRPSSRNLLDWLGAGIIVLYGRLAERSRTPIAGGFCILARRALHERIGGFDTTVTLAEDHDYIARGVAAGGRFRLLRGTYVIFSMRRFEQHGRWRTIKTWILADIYRHRHGGRVDKPFDYEFGGFSDTKKPPKQGRE